MADSNFKSVSDLLSSFFDQEMVKKGGAQAGFGRAWKTIAGPPLGEHSRPGDIRHGILLVEVEHQGWMQLLQFEQDRILAEIQRRFPELEIRGIGFRLAKDFPAPIAAGALPAEGLPPAAPPTEPATTVPEEDQLHGDAGRGALTPELKRLFGKIRKNVARNEMTGPGGKDPGSKDPDS